MGISKKYTSPLSGIEVYRPVCCFELAGKTISLKLPDGELVKLVFARFPDAYATIGEHKKVPYHAAKIDNDVLYLTYNAGGFYTALILDTARQLATLVKTGVDCVSNISFCTYNDGNGSHEFTSDLAGNTVNWSLGHDSDLALTLEFTQDSCSVKLQHDSAKARCTVNNFKVVKITDRVYLKTAVIKTDDGMRGVNMLSNYYNVTCAGSITGTKHKLFGGYGRIMGE